MKASAGFTLVELMVTVALVGIMATVAVPSWMSLIRGERLVTVSNSLIAALTYARSEAVRSGNNVSVCASSNGTSCAGDDDWSVGWLVYDDINGDNTPDTGEVRRVWEALDGTLTLTGPSGQLTYQNTGTLTTVANFAAELATCTTSEDHHDITVNISGQAYTDEGTC